MKAKLYITGLLTAGVLLSSCKKELTVDPVDFSVMSVKNDGTPSTEFKVGDTINYVFTGNPDVISFFNGTIGNRYEFNNRLQTDNGKPVLNFKTAVANPVASDASFSVMLSSDFKGIVAPVLWGVQQRDTVATTANINAATWVPLTNRAVLATNTTATASGDIDLSDIAAANKPVYLAFKYKVDAGVAQPTWTISELTLKNKLTDGTEYLLANLVSDITPIVNYNYTTYNHGGWKVTVRDTVGMKTVATPIAWQVSAGTNIAIKNNSASPATAKSGESWAIIGPINLKGVTPDIGTGIKTIENKLSRYMVPKAYTTPGTYKVVFSASNSNPNMTNGAVKELTIKIIP